MSGVSFSIDVKGDAREKLRDMIERIDDKAAFFGSASLEMHSQTMDRLTEQRGPDGTPWAPLAPLTVALRGGRATPILQDTGRFRPSISSQPEADRAVVTTNAVQAAILQFGGTITPKSGSHLIFGSGSNKVFAKSVTIPARPYFGFGDRDIDKLVEVAEASFFD